MKRSVSEETLPLRIKRNINICINVDAKESCKRSQQPATIDPNKSIFFCILTSNIQNESIKLKYFWMGAD